jgi:pimeloyl-ACP methyl ester carboxylesterase
MIDEMEVVDPCIVRLRDGRSMGYSEYGAADGYPIVNAHVGRACRLDVAAADAVAAETGIRLISPDRPGVGRSDPQPGRTILDWAGDVADLLDQIHVDGFAAMGWSMGGQYAATLGYALPHRVTRVAIIAGALPPTETGVFDALPAMDRLLTRMSLRAPWIAAQWFGIMRFASGVAPTPYGRLGARELGPADGAVIETRGSARSPGCHTRRYGKCPAPSRNIGLGSGRGVSPPRTSACRSTYGRGRATNSPLLAGHTALLHESPTPP